MLLGVGADTLSAQANWTTYGGNDWNQRYSTLTQINTVNVRSLVPRMVFQTGISRLGSFENTPIVVDNMMYVTTPYNTAIGYDLNTGKQVWRYEHKLGTTIFCCGPNNRGVAVHGPHVYMGTLDARLIALDRMTGEVAWDIEVADPAYGYSLSAAPLVIGDNVIVGVAGGEYGIRGHVTAYNAVTGEQVGAGTRSRPPGAIRPSTRWPRTAGGAPGRPTPRMAPTCTATSPPRRPTAPSTPMPGPAAAAACG